MHAYVYVCACMRVYVHVYMYVYVYTQGAIVKLRKLRNVLGYVVKRGWGVEDISAAGRGYNEVLALELRSVG